MEILWSVHHSIPKLIRRLLTGIKVATHPACHYCKVFPEEVVGNSESFIIPEELLESTGAVATGLYNEKTLHCGAGFRQRFVNPSMAVAVTRRSSAGWPRRRSMFAYICVPTVRSSSTGITISSRKRPGRATPSSTCTFSSSWPCAGGRSGEGLRPPVPLTGRDAHFGKDRCAMRAGVFLCQCGGNISDVLDVDALAERARGLGGVAEVAVLQFLVWDGGTRDHPAGRRVARAGSSGHRGLFPAFPGPTFERIAAS